MDAVLWLLPLLIPSSGTWLIVFGGDLMFNSVAPGPQTLSGVRSIIRSGDLALANLEVPITDAGTPTRAKLPFELRQRSQYVLRASPKHVDSLRVSGIGCVTLANNHAMDYGAAGLRREFAILDGIGIAHAGAGLNVQQAEKLAVLQAPGGIRVGLMSVMAFATRKALLKTTPATTVNAGVSVLNLGGKIDAAARDKLKRRLRAAHRLCDVLIVGIHWGTERKPVPNSYQVALGRALVEAGADIVWGHHPHVLEGGEWFRGHPILYSTGNLVSATPAETGLFRIRMFGTKPVGAEFFPARVRGGRVAALGGSAASRASVSFQALCRLIQHKYPSEFSTALLP